MPALQLAVTRSECLTSIETESKSESPRLGVAQRVQKHREALRAAGLRPVQIWLPDTRRAGLEAAVRKSPSNGDAWAMLSFLCVQDYAHGFKLQADALVRGLAAAQRAVEAAPNSHLSHFALAQALFFHKESQSFRNAVERAITLNPMDGNSLAFLGEMLVYSGSPERGLALTTRAKQGAASKAIRQLHRVRPDFAVAGRADVEKWWDPGFIEQLAEGWHKAGLELDRVTAPPP